MVRRGGGGSSWEFAVGIRKMAKIKSVNRQLGIQKMAEKKSVNLQLGIAKTEKFEFWTQEFEIAHGDSHR